MDRPTRDVGLSALENAGRIDVAKNGAVSVLGATTTVVLEMTTDIFGEADPSNDAEAVLQLSERMAERPLGRQDATTFVSDLYKNPTAKATSLIDLCKSPPSSTQKPIETAPFCSIRIRFATDLSHCCSHGFCQFSRQPVESNAVGAGRQ